MIDIHDISQRFSFPIARGLRLHALFGITFLCQVFNTALRHGNRPGYWAYMLLLEGPVMLFNVGFVYKFQQWLAQCKQYPSSTAVLWSYGSLTMPPSETIAQDITTALVALLAFLLLIVFWLVIYILFEDDGTLFDDTFTNGVNATELESWDGVVDNVAAQSSWRCIMLFCIHLFCPAYPISAASLFAGGCLWSGFGIDIMGSVMATILFVIAIYETIWDDDNGVGIFNLVNSTTLLIFTVPRLFRPVENSKHILMGRACYQPKEDEGATTKDQELTVREGDATESEQSPPTSV